MSLVGLASCSPGTEAALSSDKEPLRLVWTLWDGDYTALVAQEKGFFTKYGVNVELVYYEDFYQAIPDIGGGKLDGGMVAIGDMLLVTRSTGVSAIMVYDSGGTNSLVGSAELVGVEDLMNKKIGVPMGTSFEVFVRQVLAEAGVSIKDVTFVDMGPEEVPQNIPDVIQAGYVWEPYTSEALQSGHKLLAATRYSSTESLTPDLVIFRSDVIRNRPEDIQAFVNAWFDAVEYRLANPDECNQIIARITNQNIDDLAIGDARLYTREDNLSLFANNPGTDISSIYYSMQLNIDFLVSIGVLTQRPELSEILTPQFLR
jgi:NitT/TauT family transport system substrate-binding protein